jgi:hypothetical protein
MHICRVGGCAGGEYSLVFMDSRLKDRYKEWYPQQRQQDLEVPAGGQRGEGGEGEGGEGEGER